MKIILLQDDKKLGKKGQIIEANDGFARNFILPKKIGVEATPKNLNDLKLQNANKAKIEKEKLEEAKALAEKLSEMSVTLKIKAGDGGRVFGSVSTKEIAEAVKEQLGLELDKKKMVLDVPVKALGNYSMKVKLHKDVTANLTVKVQEK
jgi:large subunit ribosomal protein L9